MQKQKKGLGRGLDALLSPMENDNSSDILEIDINKIEPNLNQPRKNFDEDSLIELADSIKEHGIIQPLIVSDNGEYYSIIAGERRWRAARIAKLSKIPVIVKKYNNSEIIQIALIENLQREDLNPIEEAMGYHKLAEEFFLSQEEIASKVGKKRSVISQYMNLLSLDERVQNFIAEKKITAGHGRLLLTLDNKDLQFQMSEQVIEDNLSIKQLDLILKTLKAESEKVTPAEKKQTHTQKKENIYISLENDLKTILGSKVNIKNGQKKGKIEIEYYSNDELDRLIGMFKKIQ